jgi:hypothetical protein
MTDVSAALHREVIVTPFKKDPRDLAVVTVAIKGQAGVLARLVGAMTAPRPCRSCCMPVGSWGPSALDSTGLASYGLPGPGRFVSIYANSAHAFVFVGASTRWKRPPTT